MPADAVAAGTAERALAHYVARAERETGDRRALLADREALLATLALGAREERWRDVLRLARAVEPAFMLAARWGAWREVLEHELAAARALGDAAAEGWALHQLGSRALSLGQTEAGRASLYQALSIRERLGDRDGAAVTRHNLGIVEARPRRWRSRSALWVALLAVAGTASAATLGWREYHGSPAVPLAIATDTIAPRAARDSVATRTNVPTAVDTPAAPANRTSTQHGEVETTRRPAIAPVRRDSSRAARVVAPRDTPRVSPAIARRDTARAATVVARRDTVRPAPPKPVAPTAPTLVSPAPKTSVACAAPAQTATVRFGWRAASAPNEGAVRYEIDVHDARAAATPLAPSGLVADSARDLTLPCGADYEWRVRAVTATGGTGAWSPMSTFAVQPATVAGQPASAKDTTRFVEASFTAKPRSTSAGQPVQLCWKVSGAKYAEIDQGIGMLSGLTGCVTVRPAATTVYTLTATVFDREGKAPIDRAPTSVTVTVKP